MSKRKSVFEKSSFERGMKMNKPYLFCHMMMSVDGKIMGKYMKAPKCEDAGRVFDEITFGKRGDYRMQGWLSGRITTDDKFYHVQKARAGR